jgi:hypothetical protein
MTRKLDRKRPYAEIFGDHTAKYDQFGILFDADGNEMEGFENVTVPPEIPVITVDSDSDTLRAEIGRLAAELSSVTAELDEKDAGIEEIQGKLDTAQVEISRLTAALAESAPTGKGKGNKSTNTQDSTPDPLLDDQLKANGVM